MAEGRKGSLGIWAEARRAIQCIRDGTRAGAGNPGRRALLEKVATAKAPLDLNEAVREVIVLTRREMNPKVVALRLTRLLSTVFKWNRLIEDDVRTLF